MLVLYKDKYSKLISRNDSGVVNQKFGEDCLQCHILLPRNGCLNIVFVCLCLVVAIDFVLVTDLFCGYVIFLSVGHHSKDWQLLFV